MSLCELWLVIFILAGTELIQGEMDFGIKQVLYTLEAYLIGNKSATEAVGCTLFIEYLDSRFLSVFPADAAWS